MSTQTKLTFWGLLSAPSPSARPEPAQFSFVPFSLCLCGDETPLIHHVPVLIRGHARGGQPVPVRGHRGRRARMGTWLGKPLHLSSGNGFNRILQHFLAVNIALVPIPLRPQLCHLHMQCLLETLGLGGALDAAAMVGLRDCVLLRFRASFGLSVEWRSYLLKGVDC